MLTQRRAHCAAFPRCSELSHRGDAPLDAPYSARGRRRAAPLPTELDELRETLCDDDLALIAGEVDFHANALKRAVAVRFMRTRRSERRSAGLTCQRGAARTQGHVLTLQSKLAASVSALEAERRFIVARSITLQTQADSLKARALAARWPAPLPTLLTGRPSAAVAQEALFKERIRTGNVRNSALSCVAGGQRVRVALH